MSTEQILGDFSELSDDHIRGALAFAAQRSDGSQHLHEGMIPIGWRCRYPYPLGMRPGPRLQLSRLVCSSLLTGIALAAMVACSSAPSEQFARSEPAPSAAPPTASALSTPTSIPQPTLNPLPTPVMIPTAIPQPVPLSEETATACEIERSPDVDRTVIDLDKDGRDEMLEVSPTGQRFADVTLFAMDEQGCPTVIVATGHSFGSAGAPQGFGCVSAGNGVMTFVDWEQQWFTYSKDGTDTTSQSLITWRQTRLNESAPSTTSHHAFDLTYAGAGIPRCTEESRLTDGPTGVISSIAAFPGTVSARDAGRCVTDHMSITPPDGWYAIRTEPDNAGSDGPTYLCSIFSPRQFSAPLQCDCYLPINIVINTDMTLDEAVGSSTVVRQEIVDGFDAVVAKQSVSSELYGDFERWMWFIEKDDDVVIVDGSTAESDIPIADLARLVDDMVATVAMHSLAPPDRPCASGPGDPTIGPTFYLDVDGDGVYEALAPQKFDMSGENVVTVHQMLAANGDCDWTVVQQLPRDSGSYGRQWQCVLHADGVRLRTVVSNTQGESLEAEIWAGTQRLGLATAEALALEAVPCDHDG